MRRSARFFRRHRITSALLLLAVGVAVLVAANEALAWGRYASWRSRLAALPSAETDAAPGAATTALVAFRYRGVTRFVRVPVVERELAASRALSTRGAFSTRGSVRAAYLRHLVRASADSYAVDGMAHDLRALRVQLGLDSDEYVDLITRLVQSVPYGSPRAEFGLPVEVAYDGRAVCSDKSVLLAALLLHEGYDTGVWVLDSQLHAAGAVRGVGPGFQSSGYAFVETTARAFVGETPQRYAGNGPWAFRPQLIRVGGTRRYTADVENEFIASRLRTAASSARELAPFHEYLRVASPYQARNYASFISRQVADSRLATKIEASADDRDTIWRLLTRNGGR